jgi:hypothetical protein
MKNLFTSLLASGLLLSSAAIAQTPGFRAGVRAGIGVSHFSKVQSLSARDILSYEAGFIASKPLTSSFSIDAYPAFIAAGSAGVGTTIETSEVSSEYYKFRDQYRIYSIGLPVAAKFTMALDHMSLKWFAGPEAGFHILATQNRVYDDADYNVQHGYENRDFRDLEPVTFSVLIGFGMEIANSKGVFGLDYRLRQPVSATGRIDGDKFFIHASTIGLSWMY